MQHKELKLSLVRHAKQLLAYLSTQNNPILVPVDGENIPLSITDAMKNDAERWSQVLLPILRATDMPARTIVVVCGTLLARASMGLLLESGIADEELTQEDVNLLLQRTSLLSTASLVNGISDEMDRFLEMLNEEEALSDGREDTSDGEDIPVEDNPDDSEEDGETISFNDDEDDEGEDYDPEPPEEDEAFENPVAVADFPGSPTWKTRSSLLRKQLEASVVGVEDNDLPPLQSDVDQTREEQMRQKGPRLDDIPSETFPPVMEPGVVDRLSKAPKE